MLKKFVIAAAIIVLGGVFFAAYLIFSPQGRT